MRRATAALAAGILVAAGGLSGGLARASSEERWLHIRVEEHTGKHESVRVNIPLSLVESVAPLLDDVDLGHEGKLRVNDKDLDAVQLRKFLEAVRKSPDAQYVAVESEDQHVDVSKSGDTLYIRVRDDGDEETAEVKLPIAVVDALLSAPDGKLDLSAAIKALGDRGTGDLVTVTGRDEHVRIWIDASNTSK